ncbi:MAG TPA: GNAT family protein [Jatrophihabitans sp.]|jgi:RimJ/RimL family protein N-acetyltransferase|uniref:GNAT family N-acetyltransferase n=1 Tax=Jatrophihabitans sp. TaxID=1932789 RepID=UPI002F2271EA
MPAHPYWPLWDVRLSVADLQLRPMTEADQLPLADLLPDDLELDPQATRYPGLDEATNRRVIGFQSYWSSYGSWKPERWRLPFCVRVGGELVGVQELEAEDFALLRTVDSASHLAPRVRGRGIGKQMRRAVLALAFGPLQAEAAITSAWHDNHASLAVSRALGYQPNGESLHPRGNGVDTMTHLRLRRSQWLAAGGAAGVVLEGVPACLPYFGLTS